LIGSFAQAERDLRARVLGDEVVIAVGRADVRASNARKRADVRGSFLLVTEQRLLWTDVGPSDRVEGPRFDDVRAALEQMDSHRLRLTLRHRPLDRLAHVPAYHVWFIAGGDHRTQMPFGETRLMFSRPSTLAARAIRDSLEAVGGISTEELSPVAHPSREVRLGRRSAPCLAERPRIRPVKLWRFRLRRATRRTRRSPGGRS
jgi:hypothetical protein